MRAKKRTWVMAGAFLSSPLMVALIVAGCSSSPVTTQDTGTPASDTEPAADLKHSDLSLTGPWANVYKINPTDDNKKTTQVQLADLTGTKLKLTGKWTDTYNCLPESSGEKITIPLLGSGVLCTVKKKAAAGSDKTFLQITPPSSDIVGNDAFAEVMMYHHVTTIHDHFSKDFGLTHIDSKSLRSIVNLQGKADLLGDTWIGLPNAAYVPKDSSDILKQLGIDLGNGDDVIVFGFNNYLPSTMMPQVNFSYDASVIYHEYTHYAIGEALWSPGEDKYGLDPSPKGLNEGLADYMASSFLGKSKLGSYALGSQARDLSRSYKCPDHIVGEEHNDGEIASGALWEARTLIGAKVLDQAIWNAVLTFQKDTTFEDAATAILAEIKKVDPTHESALKTIFEDHGMIGCTRLVDYKDFSASLTGVSPGYSGTSSAPTVFSSTGVPAYLQYKLTVESDTKEITIVYTPVSGGMYGIGGTLGDVSVALLPGSDPITYDYTSGKAVSAATAVLDGTKQGTTALKLVISGDCVKAGDLVFQFIANGTADGSITSVTITQSSTVTNTTDNFTGCT
jgi:hypothetical protein